MNNCMAQGVSIPEDLVANLEDSSAFANDGAELKRRLETHSGPNPGGTTGVGYGELNGAKPLTEPWHTR